MCHRFLGNLHFDEMFEFIFKCFVIFCSVGFSMEDDIYKSDKKSLYFHQYNLSVVINFSQSMGHLYFNFTFDESPNENLTVTIINLPSSNPKCDVILATTINEPEFSLGKENDLNFGCTYDITVNELSLNYSIPYCVDGKCDCDIHAIPMNFTMDYQGKNEFLIAWDFTNPEDKDTLENITFDSYISDDCNFIPDSTDIREPKHKLFDLNNYALIYVEDNSNLCLLTTFKNKFSCGESFLRELIVEDEDEVNNSTWINISNTLISIILLLVVVVLLYIHKCRNTIKTVLSERVGSRGHNIYGYEINNTSYIEHEILVNDF